MKKISTLIAGIGFVLACQYPGSVWAQTKSCDLAIQYTSPHNNNIYISGDTAKVRFKIINYGPDDISSEDTIYMYCTDYPSITYFYPLTPIPTGDTASSGYAYLEYYNYSNTNDTFTNCAYLVHRSTTFNDPNPNNDTADCVTFILKGNDNTGISNNEMPNSANFTLSPNPAKDHVSVRWTILNCNSFMTITITNILGEPVWQNQYDQTIQNRVQHDDIDISSFAKGIYFVSLTNQQFRTTQKLIVQ